MAIPTATTMTFVWSGSNLVVVVLSMLIVMWFAWWIIRYCLYCVGVWRYKAGTVKNDIAAATQHVAHAAHAVYDSPDAYASAADYTTDNSNYIYPDDPYHGDSVPYQDDYSERDAYTEENADQYYEPNSGPGGVRRRAGY